MKSSMPDVAGPDSDASDSLPEDLYGDSDDALSPMAKNSNDEDSSDDEGSLGPGFEEEDDDIVGSGADAPDGLLHLSSDEAQEEEVEVWGGIGGDIVATEKKRKAKDQPNGDKRKKRRLRDLPTFASVEQYAKLIDEADEENL
jgi:ribosome biogenesis protein MAK21